MPLFGFFFSRSGTHLTLLNSTADNLTPSSALGPGASGSLATLLEACSALVHSSFVVLADNSGCRMQHSRYRLSCPISLPKPEPRGFFSSS